MKCPACQSTDLLMSERQGVEIDYCPSCRGVWLDRGELDKIIERSGGDEAPPSSRATRPAPAQPHTQPHPHDPRYGDPNDSSHYGYQYHPQTGKPYKRKSFLRELFDF